MRERITYVQKSESRVDPEALKIEGRSIAAPDLEAAREERLTLAIDELPQELRAVLEEAHEIHIRWASSRPYEAVSPLFSRLSPGFHLFFTARQDASKDSTKLCSLLKATFGAIHCSTPLESFTSLPLDRFSHSAAFQYFQPLDSLSAFASYARGQLCSAADPVCSARIDRLAKAVALDISYDTISHALKATALWPYQKQPLQLSSSAQHRTEVGILAADIPPNLEPHELGISGLLAVLGQDSKPSGTIFAFPSRHRDAESSFEAKLLEPTGLHPTLQLRLESNKPPREEGHCKAHAYFTLPRTIFADKYQLADELFLSSKNLSALQYSSMPVDLEAPDYVMEVWGSSILLELAPPDTGKPQPWTAEVPLHLRYLSPLHGGYRSIEIPHPAVFWACAAEEGTKFPTNPFDRANLGYDGLFGPRTVFWHVEPRAARSGLLLSTVNVPVLDLDKADWVNVGTSATILLGFAFLAWKLLSLYLKSGHGTVVPRVSEKRKRK